MAADAQLIPIGWPEYPVTDDSMEPTLRLGDVVYVDYTPVPVERLDGFVVAIKDGQDVAFRRLTRQGDFAVLARDSSPSKGEWHLPEFRIREIVLGRVVIVKRPAKASEPEST